MNILCKLFGHKPPVYAKKGWWSPGEEYGKITQTVVDGVGREYALITGECARCGDQFKVIRIHLPKVDN